MSATRDPHAALDDRSRVLKASKILAQLRAARALEGASVLDIGCGNGVIARELARAVGPTGSVFGVDVVDQRTTFEGYKFTRVSDTTLPFAERHFDVVISNHCIEHVGGHRDQLNHLMEIKRVLRAGGICYLAVPNRWTLVEPHFRLPFLSWLPKGMADALVRISRRGTHYDCNIPSTGLLTQLLHKAGFDAEEITVGALPLIYEIEKPSGLRKLLLHTPSPVARHLTTLMPTRMYLLSRDDTAPAATDEEGACAF